MLPDRAVLLPPTTEMSPPRGEAEEPPIIDTRAAGRVELPEDPAATSTLPATPRAEVPLLTLTAPVELAEEEPVKIATSPETDDADVPVETVTRPEDC